MVDNLLSFYLDNTFGDYQKYSLSDYAIKFLELIGKKLFKEHIHFPLRQTFQNYSLFKSDDIKSLLQFQEWYQNGFHNTSRENINEHLAYLEDLVKKSVFKLNKLVLKENNDTIKTLEKFVEIFKMVASKCEEISEILRLSSTLKIEISTVINLFASRKDDFPHPKNSTERESFKALVYEYEQAIEIEERVSDFFDTVDKKLRRIRDRSLYASVQLDYYKENFRNHSQFRLNLKRFLTHTVKNVHCDNNSIMTFSPSFPVRSIPSESFKFINVKHYDDFIKPKNIIVPPLLDETHQKTQFAISNQLLEKQESIARLTKDYKILLAKEEYLNFTPHFYKILEQEKDEEIALSVCFELLKYANENKGYILEIDPSLQSLDNKNTIKLWNLTIQKAK